MTKLNSLVPEVGGDGISRLMLMRVADFIGHIADRHPDVIKNTLKALGQKEFSDALNNLEKLVEEWR